MVPNLVFKLCLEEPEGSAEMSQGHKRKGTQRQQVKGWEQGFYTFCGQHCSRFNSFYILGSPRASIQKWHLILKEQNNKKAL